MKKFLKLFLITFICGVLVGSINMAMGYTIQYYSDYEGTLTFDVPQNKPEGEPVNLITDMPDEGGVFKCWTDKDPSDPKNYYPGDQYNIDADLSLYPVYSSDYIQFQVGTSGDAVKTIQLSAEGGSDIVIYWGDNNYSKYSTNSAYQHEYGTLGQNYEGVIVGSGAQSLQFADGAQVRSVNFSNNYNSLTSFSCANNSLSSLDMTKCQSIQTINVSNNAGLQTLTVNGLTSLEELDCSQCSQLSELNVNGCTSLTTLDWSNCSVGTLNYNNCPNLTNMTYTSLYSVTTLRCEYCGLNELDLSGYTNLRNLYCSSNNFSTLDTSGLTQLRTIQCNQSNNLKYLDLSNSPNLQGYSLNCDNLELIVMPNRSSYNPVGKNSGSALIKIEAPTNGAVTVNSIDVESTPATCTFAITPSQGFVRSSVMLGETNLGVEAQNNLYVINIEDYASAENVLTATFETEGYTITFNSNGGTGTMDSQKFGTNETKALSLNTFEKDGFIFDSWNTNILGEGASYEDGGQFTATNNQELYAQWKRYVEFNANGGTGTMAPEKFDENETKPLSFNTFKRTGFMFDSWNTSIDGTGTRYENEADYTMTESQVLYAQWKICVTYDSNGGTGSMEPQEFEIDETKPLLSSTFTRDGYKFVNWNTASDGSGIAYEDGAEITPQSSLKLYAQWKKKSSGSSGRSSSSSSSSSSTNTNTNTNTNVNTNTNIDATPDTNTGTSTETNTNTETSNSTQEQNTDITGDNQENQSNQEEQTPENTEIPPEEIPLEELPPEELPPEVVLEDRSMIILVGNADVYEEMRLPVKKLLEIYGVTGNVSIKGNSATLSIGNKEINFTNDELKIMYNGQEDMMLRSAKIVGSNLYITLSDFLNLI